MNQSELETKKSATTRRKMRETNSEKISTLLLLVEKMAQNLLRKRFHQLCNAKMEN